MLRHRLDAKSKYENEIQIMKRKFEINFRMNNDQLSRARGTFENQMLEIARYVTQVEQLKEIISDLHVLVQS